MRSVRGSWERSTIERSLFQWLQARLCESLHRVQSRYSPRLWVGSRAGGEIRMRYVTADLAYKAVSMLETLVAPGQTASNEMMWPAGST